MIAGTIAATVVSRTACASMKTPSIEDASNVLIQAGKSPISADWEIGVTGSRPYESLETAALRLMSISATGESD